MRHGAFLPNQHQTSQYAFFSLDPARFGIGCVFAAGMLATSTGFVSLTSLSILHCIDIYIFWSATKFNSKKSHLNRVLSEMLSISFVSLVLPQESSPRRGVLFCSS